jgi:integrase
MRLDRAVDLYIADLARKGKSPATLRTYESRLVPMCGDRSVVEPGDASEITANDCRLYLDRWRNHAAGTRYHSWAVLSGFFKFLYRAEVIARNPMERVEPPKRLSPEELDVVTVTGSDVRRLFNVCETWGELLCLSTLAYLGPRLGAVSKLRWSDVDLERGTILFREKGSKSIRKPIPLEFAGLLRAARLSGEVDCERDDYVVPMQRKQRHGNERDDRVIWRYVRQLGERAGVRATPHSLRAAFAVLFLETHPGELEALQRLLGHRKPETTQIYLRRMDKREGDEAG